MTPARAGVFGCDCPAESGINQKPAVRATPTIPPRWDDQLGTWTSDAEAEGVHTDNLRAHRLGINGVPCFVVDGTHAIAGAQEPEVIERMLDIATVDAVRF